MASFPAKWAAPFLEPLSVLYGMAIEFRNLLYARRIMPVEKLDRPVISVGNLTAGGVGKTPVVIFLTKLLAQRGKHIAILTRGYRRQRNGQILIAPGTAEKWDPYSIGDEPYLLVQNLKGTPVVVDKNRGRGARAAMAHFPIDGFLMDDGFQYRKLHRDLDILVLDVTNPFGYGRLLPAGLMREPKRSLLRADLIWLTRVDQNPQAEGALKNLCQQRGLPCLSSVHRPVALENLQGERSPLDALVGARVLVFSGIGNPEAFSHTIRSLGMQVMDHIIFWDHHRYAIKDIRRIQSRYRDLKADGIVTTEKDAFKVQSLWNPSCPLWYIKIEVCITSGKENLLQKLDTLNWL